MARTISEIQTSIQDNLRSSHSGLSDSKAAEWRLWAYIVAAAIHAFEVLHDLFRSEMETLTNKITPGTARWYAEMCYRYQFGHKLEFDPRTAMLYYPEDDPDARIIRMVAITEEDNTLVIKVAKFDDSEKIVELSGVEYADFVNYVDAIKFAGVRTYIITQDPDQIRYDLVVYFDPAVPRSLCRENVLAALEAFKTSLSFDAMFYPERLVEAVLAAEGVVTARLRSIHHREAGKDFLPITQHYVELKSGYFEYTNDSEPELISIKEKTEE